MELGLGAGGTGLGDARRRTRLARAREAFLSAMGRWTRPAHRLPPAISDLLPGTRDLGLRRAAHGLDRNHATTSSRHHGTQTVRDGSQQRARPTETQGAFSQAFGMAQMVPVRERSREHRPCRDFASMGERHGQQPCLG